MEIVLGIDNIIFIAIICGYIRIVKNKSRARIIGLLLALVSGLDCCLPFRGLQEWLIRYFILEVLG